MATIENFHAHIYFDPPELARAQALAAAARERFSVPIGHFHEGRSARTRAAAAS